MIASYYFWKWADNDLPGKPVEVHAALLRGELHPALQTFDARPVLVRLEEFAAAGREQGEEWEWQVQPQDSAEHARFVFMTCPQVDASEEQLRYFMRGFNQLGVSGYDEKHGWVIPGLPPKLNSFSFGQFPYEPVYDITLEELPVLLRRIRPGGKHAWGQMVVRTHKPANATGVMAIAKGLRYRVEWGEKHSQTNSTKFVFWKARDQNRLAALNAPQSITDLPHETDPDFLTYADTLKIFQTFLRGEPRPSQYHWCITEPEPP